MEAEIAALDAVIARPGRRGTSMAELNRKNADMNFQVGKHGGRKTGGGAEYMRWGR